MAKLRMSSKKKSGIVQVKLNVVVEKLQRSFILGKRSASNTDKFKEVNESTTVPDDVKEGHFAVIAADDDEFKRFVVPLSYLAHPVFLRLLEQAAEEYGFDHEGALTVPCRPNELERILAEQSMEEGESRVRADWSSCKRMVKSC
ncbi:hypothetical protein RJ639_015325 [Escallonia herrerae]|uniref:Small auxin up regulated protein n=1 Tax=Escallonia herrerae TaxID=1293975 RepID=A0AA88VGP0_9ASTE|nr:hypothetical protein RJ639_015325 [Escallonia herrerae]